MAAYTQIGYSVADIAALKAIPPADRPAFAGALVSVVSTNQWFEFDPAGASGGITPNSGSGRWYAMNREVLNADRIYFVRTDGNDDNTGLANTAGGAFLTIQKAIDTVASLDIGIYDVTIQIADGTYTGGIILKNYIGAGKIVIQGNTTTPSSVILTNTSDVIRSDGYQGLYQLKGVRLQSSGANCIYLRASGSFEWGLVDFGTCASVHLAIENSVIASLIDAYTISGSAAIHLYSLGGGFLTLTGVTGKTVTISGNPNFSSFAYAARTGIIQAGSTYVVFSGSATGKRYEVIENGVIAATTSTSYFPGNVAGTTTTGGQYS